MMIRSSDLEIYIEGLKNNINLIKDNKKVSFYNVPCAFDIEVSSVTEGDHKAAYMYIWMFGIDNLVFYGRTWEEYFEFYNKLSQELGTSSSKRLVCYIHNLAYEFQFFRKRHRWENIFATDVRKVLKALTNEGIEYRCSYILSGQSLARVGDGLKDSSVKKMTGDLDYNLIRHSRTPLTKKEMGYCENDIRVLLAYIKEKMEQDGDITKIELTKTGYARTYCRNACLFDNKSHEGKQNHIKWSKYRKIMNRLVLTPEEYLQLKKAYAGGFSHACHRYVRKVLKNVTSYDIGSSYPTALIAEKYPMGKGHKATFEELSDPEFIKESLQCYCCLVDVEFINIESTSIVEHYISSSRVKYTIYDEVIDEKGKVVKKTGAVVDNGRLVKAKGIRMTITEQDLNIIKKLYKYESVKIYGLIRYTRGYLPTDLVKAIVKLYKDKTILKGALTPEEEEMYALAKELLNSCYGMMCTDIAQDEHIYNGTDWTKEPVNLEEAIEKYNGSYNRFLSYAWGCWCTAYARRNLFMAILNVGEDYVYSDTDSCKFINGEKHKEFFERYNKWISNRIVKACEYHNIPIEDLRPKTNKGVEKPIGLFEYEGTYDMFKTLGAKRYMTYSDGILDITVAGLNKKTAVPYMLEKCEIPYYTENGKCHVTDENDIDKVFEFFKKGMYVPEEFTGKNTHTYIDIEVHDMVTDYLGNTMLCEELSGVHLGPCDFTLSIGKDFERYLAGFVEKEK